MADTQEISFREQKKAAIIRRANKFIEWLGRDEYAVYFNESSTDDLVKLIKLIIYAHEKNVPIADWQPFLRRFRNIRKLANKQFETEEEKKANHTIVITKLTDTLEKYKIHMQFLLTE